MNTKLLARLENLESAMVDVEKPGLTIFICGIEADNGKPAAVQPEPVGARSMAGDWHLERVAGETVNDFKERVKVLAPRKNGVAGILFVYPADRKAHVHGG